jgi:hypothetical protein
LLKKFDQSNQNKNKKNKKKGTDNHHFNQEGIKIIKIIKK